MYIAIYINILGCRTCKVGPRIEVENKVENKVKNNTFLYFIPNIPVVVLSS